MNKIAFSIVCILIFTVNYSQTPISLSNSNMPGSGDTLRYSNALFTSIGNYTQTGTNYNWDFSNISPTGQGVRSFKSSFQTPYALFFLALNEYGEKIADTLGAGPITMTNYYNFYKKQSSPSAFIADGVGLTYSSVPIPNYYSDKDELYLFPLTYPDYDSTTFKFSTASNTLIPIRYIKTGYRVTKVDGWGSVTTPYSTANCIRLITTQYSQDSVKNNLLPFQLPAIPNNQRSYQWLTTGSKIPFLEVTGNLVGNNFTITQIRYRDIPRVITGIGEYDNVSELDIYPNPVKDRLYLKTKENEYYSAEIHDLNGRLIRTQDLNSAGELTSIDLNGIEAGLYIIKLLNGNKINYFKFIKE